MGNVGPTPVPLTMHMHIVYYLGEIDETKEISKKKNHEAHCTSHSMSLDFVSSSLWYAIWKLNTGEIYDQIFVWKID